MTDDGLRHLLLQLSPSARDHLRTVLIREDRDEIALIDTLTMYPDVRRQVVRMLAEIDAAG